MRNLIQKYLLKHHKEYFEDLMERIKWNEIGFTGHVTDIDKSIAEEKGLKNLNKFERWLVMNDIKILRKERMEQFVELLKRNL